MGSPTIRAAFATVLALTAGFGLGWGFHGPPPPAAPPSVQEDRRRAPKTAPEAGTETQAEIATKTAAAIEPDESAPAPLPPETPSAVAGILDELLAANPAFADRCWPAVAVIAANAGEHQMAILALRRVPPDQWTVRRDSQIWNALTTLPRDRCLAFLEEQCQGSGRYIAAVWYHLGDLHRYADRADEAFRGLATAHQLDPGNRTILLELSSALPERSLPFLEQAVERDPRATKLWERLGNTYEGMGRTEEAMRCYEEALQRGQLESWRCLYQLRSLDRSRAAAILEPIVAETGTPQAWLELVDTYPWTGEDDKRRHAFLQAVRADETGDGLQNRPWNVPLAWLQRAVEARPEHGPLWHALAERSLRRGRVETATHAYRQAAACLRPSSNVYTEVLRALQDLAGEGDPR